MGLPFVFIWLFTLIVTIVFFFWMLQMLKLTRQNRIINSMILKVMREQMKNENISIDIEKIKEEVIKNL